MTYIEAFNRITNMEEVIKSLLDKERVYFLIINIFILIDLVSSSLNLFKSIELSSVTNLFVSIMLLGLMFWFLYLRTECKKDIKFYQAAQSQVERFKLLLVDYNRTRDETYLKKIEEMSENFKVEE